MNTIVLKPGTHALDFAYFTAGLGAPAVTGRLEDYRHAADERSWARGALVQVLDHCLSTLAGPPAAVAVRVPFGGNDFSAPTPATPAVLARLAALAYGAPLHIPATLALVRAAGEAFPGIPFILAFETAFFATLPAREYLYGLDPALAKDLRIRRFGYHGLYHAAACRGAARDFVAWQRERAASDSASSRPARLGRRTAEQRTPPLIISICLEPRPEIAAVIGSRPVTVTSGATPLEGLPGQTSCGEIDPSIVLSLNKELNWGPEEINAVLTEESGFVGLVGRHVTLNEVFTSDAADVTLAREVMRYRILLACGSAVAALGGVDAIVFSGRYARLGEALGPWLAERLTFPAAPRTAPIRLVTFTETLDRIIADAAAVATLAADTAAAG